MTSTTTNTITKKRPYRKTGKYSKATTKAHAKKPNAKLISEAVNTMLSLTSHERELVIGLFN